MKRVSLLVLAVLSVAVVCAASALGAGTPRTEPLPPPERSVNLVLAGSPGNDRITIELSVDGRSYEIQSATPLEISGAGCAHPEKHQDELVCEARMIAGFEINTGAGEDTVTLGAGVPAPATIRGGEGNDVLTGGSAADKLIGGPGEDELVGRGGNDLLIGGPGEDKLNGGPGQNILRP